MSVSAGCNDSIRIPSSLIPASCFVAPVITSVAAVRNELEGAYRIPN